MPARRWQRRSRAGGRRSCWCLTGWAGHLLDRRAPSRCSGRRRRGGEGDIHRDRGPLLGRGGRAIKAGDQRRGRGLGDELLWGWCRGRWGDRGDPVAITPKVRINDGGAVRLEEKAATVLIEQGAELEQQLVQRGLGPQLGS